MKMRSCSNLMTMNHSIAYKTWYKFLYSAFLKTKKKKSFYSHWLCPKKSWTLNVK